MRGRTPDGPEAVQRLDGSALAKRRLGLLLQVLGGHCRVQQACTRLGVKPARWAQLRQRALQAAVAALEPRPAGRRRRRHEVTPEQVQALTEQVRQLELELRLAQSRAEVAEIRGGAPSPRPTRGGRRKRTATADNEGTGNASAALDEGDGGADPGLAASTAQPVLAAANPRDDTTTAAPEGRGGNRLRWPAAVLGQQRRGHRGARGWSRQRPQRQAEVAVRACLAQTATWARQHGWHAAGLAGRLDVSDRSLRRWSAGQAKVVARGRPVRRSSWTVRQEVLRYLSQHGPGISVAHLRAAFPSLLRAELVDLRQRYRRLYRQRQRRRLARLSWTQAGVVWAADFTWPPAPIEGRYPRVFAVRDLASGMQLAWRPVTGESAAETSSILAGLFAEHGAPLVLKLDNGPAFHAQQLGQLLAPQGVVVLYSPAYTPRYNGGIEAGVGAMKGRTEMQAWLRGAERSWTWDDLEAARQEANAAPVGRRESEPTRAEVWSARPRLDVQTRAALAAEMLRQQSEVRVQQLRTEAEASAGRVPDKACLWRRVLRRALVALGYLVLSWRRIPLPIEPQKTDKIT
jgi:hypothetical protein